MSNYKELIDELRTYILAPPRQTTTIEQQAADVIEQLVRERDDALLQHRTEYCESASYDCVELGRLREENKELREKLEGMLITLHGFCSFCKHVDCKTNEEPCKDCYYHNKEERPNWEFRGT